MVQGVLLILAKGIKQELLNPKNKEYGQYTLSVNHVLLFLLLGLRIQVVGESSGLLFDYLF